MDSKKLVRKKTAEHEYLTKEKFDAFDKMQKNIGVDRLISYDDLDAYVRYSHGQRLRRNDDKIELKHEVMQRQIMTMFMIDDDTAGMLGDLFRLETRQAALLTRQYQADAKVSGVNKLMHDMFGSRRREARHVLERLKVKKQQLGYLANRAGKVKIRRTDYAAADGKVELIKKDVEDGWRYNPIHAFGAYIATGSKSERRKKSEFIEYKEKALNENIELRTPKGILRGKFYKPVANATGKVVIIYTGRGNTNANMSKSLSGPYVNAGAMVLCVDLRGFGNSVSCDKKGNLSPTYVTEDGMYADAREIYDYALKKYAGKKASNVIIHGYSLAGAVASKMAADIAGENALKLKKGEKVTENDRLGGLVLSSPVDKFSSSVTHTLKSATVGKIARATGLHQIVKGLTYIGAGGFDTEDHLRTLHKYDANIPVMYLSGESKFGDFLSIQETHIDNVKGAKFANTATYTGMHDHAAAIKANKSSDPYDYELPYEKVVRIVKYGRAADLVSVKQDKPVEIEGLDSSNKSAVLSDDECVSFVRNNLSVVGITNADCKKVLAKGLTIGIKRQVSAFSAEEGSKEPEKIAYDILNNEFGGKMMEMMENRSMDDDDLLKFNISDLPVDYSDAAAGMSKEEQAAYYQDKLAKNTAAFDEQCLKYMQEDNSLAYIAQFRESIIKNTKNVPEEKIIQAADIVCTKLILASISTMVRRAGKKTEDDGAKESYKLMSQYYTLLTGKYADRFFSYNSGMARLKKNSYEIISKQYQKHAEEKNINLMKEEKNSIRRIMDVIHK